MHTCDSTLKQSIYVNMSLFNTVEQFSAVSIGKSKLVRKIAASPVNSMSTNTVMRASAS